MALSLAQPNSNVLFLTLVDRGYNIPILGVDRHSNSLVYLPADRHDWIDLNFG
jgi:hypothetical protein